MTDLLTPTCSERSGARAGVFTQFVSFFGQHNKHGCRRDNDSPVITSDGRPVGAGLELEPLILGHFGGEIAHAVVSQRSATMYPQPIFQQL